MSTQPDSSLPPPVVGAQGPGASVTQHIYQAARPAPKLSAPFRSLQAALIARHSLFGGRDGELQRLDQLVSGSTRGYHFVTGPSGFGKTALLANWIGRLQSRARPVSFHFVSRLDGMAGEAMALRNLCEQLGEYHAVRGELPVNTDELRALYVRLLKLEPPDGETLTVVLDGLDEALDWASMRPLFPELPARAHVVFSARAENDEHRRTWLSNVGLTRDRVDVVALDTLAAHSIGGLLRNAGGKAAEHAARPGFVDAVRDASKGDPFYLRLLVEDILAGDIGADDVATRPQGLHAYLAAWKEQLLGDVDLNRDEIYALLGVLTAAFGPLRPKDLSGISPALRRGALLNQELGGKLRRHLSGDRQTGYALCHPRFRDFLCAELFTPEEIEDYRAQLLTYCGRWREHRSDYALTHYPSHLAQAGRRAELYALIDDDWKAARLQQTSSLLAFAGDVELAIATSESEAAPDLVQIARGSLIYATLTTIAERLPPVALRALAHSGRPQLARDYAALVKDPGDQAKAYLMIADALVDTAPALAGEVLEVAGLAAGRIRQASDRCDVLLGIANAFSRLEDVAALSRAVASLEDLAADPLDSDRLKAIAQCCTRAGRPDAAARLQGLAEDTAARTPKGLSFVLNNYATVTAFAAAGRFEEASQVAAAETFLSDRVRGLLAVADALASQGASDQALGFARRGLAELDAARPESFAGLFESRKETLLCEAAVTLARAGDARAAEETVMRALPLADEPGTFGWQSRVSRLAGVARTLAELGHRESARRVAGSALAADEPSMPSDLSTLAALLRLFWRVGAAQEVVTLAARLHRAAADTVPGVRHDRDARGHGHGACRRRAGRGCRRSDQADDQARRGAGIRAGEDLGARRAGGGCRRGRRGRRRRDDRGFGAGPAGRAGRSGLPAPGAGACGARAPPRAVNG